MAHMSRLTQMTDEVIIPVVHRQLAYLKHHAWCGFSGRPKRNYASRVNQM